MDVLIMNNEIQTLESSDPELEMLLRKAANINAKYRKGERETRIIIGNSQLWYPVNRKNQEQEIILDKVDRNDICPCNSGKKYKKCCMDKN
jgi:uncharacterized protein YecA (UPF0149 family)